MTTRINPSILAADWANLEHELGRISTADLVHVDIMDNHFVPNLTFGLQMVERLQEVSPIPLDVHLMIDDPDRWAPAYAEAGAFSVTFHAEAAGEPVALARRLREIGARAGIALKPGTDATPVPRPPARVRPGARDDGRARLRRPVVHPRDDAEAAPGRRRGARRRARRLAAGRRRHHGRHDRHRGRGRAPTRSWPGRRCSAATCPPSASRRCATPRQRTRTRTGSLDE